MTININYIKISNQNICRLWLLFCMLWISLFIFGQESTLIVDNFDHYREGSLSTVWKGRSDNAFNEYKIKIEDNENSYVEAISQKSDMFLLKEIKVDLVKFPYLNWRWRVNEYPPNGDESVKKYCDNPASVAVVFRLSKWRPKSIKYSWSTTLDQDTRTSSPYAIWPSRSDIIVMRSGKDKEVGWVTEKRNVLQDYMDLYNDHDVKEKFIYAIVIMTDGDNTKSNSAADYDDIYFSSN